MFRFRKGKHFRVRNSINYLWIIFVAYISIFEFWKHIDYWLLVIGVFLLGLLVYSIPKSLAQIEINDNGISYKSYFRKGFIKWDDVNYFEIRSYMGRHHSNISYKEANTFTISRKLICISKQDKSVTLTSQKSGIDYITFGYDKSIYQYIESQLPENPKF
jgi:hypothetical protein